MRVAISAWFWNSLTTGSGQYTRRLVTALAQVAPDLDIRLVAPGSPWFRPTAWSFSDTAGRWPPSSAGSASPSNLAKVWFEQVAFPTASRRLRADVAHVPYWAPPLNPSCPMVVTIHDLIPLLLPKYRRGRLVRLYTSLVSRSARSASLVLTDSEAARRDIVNHLRLRAGRVRTVPLAASDGYSPEPAADDATTRARLKLPACYVLYLGGFDERKNVATTLAAFRQALTTLGNTCPLVIAGRLPEHDSTFAPDPRRLARELGIDGQLLRFPGVVDEDDAPAVYRGASAFIFPSRYEGFGLPPLEAMACGTPVVGSNSSSMPEIIGDAGMLFDPDDAAGMASALVRLVCDRPLRAEFSQRSVIQAARFSWRRTAELTLAAYQIAAAVA